MEGSMSGSEPQFASEQIMDLLKGATAVQHHDAERRRLQRELISGRLPKAEYTVWLGQMLLLHEALLEEIHRGRSSEPKLDAIVRDEGHHVANLRSDLAALGGAPDSVVPLPSTARAIADIRAAAQSGPLTLLGYNYVLEGSMNGNRFIARAILKQGEHAAVRYLYPYGEEQPANWAAYRSRMSAAGISETQAERIVAAAKELFSAIAGMSDEVMRSA